MSNHSVEEPGALAESIDWWDLEYVALDEQLICPICRTAFVEPCTTDCGHTFCRECLNETWKTGNVQDLVCPIDRVKVNPEFQLAPFIVRSLLDELVVLCPFRHRGCDFQGKRWLLDAHVTNDCDFVEVFCHPPCTKHVQRWQFSSESCACPTEDSTHGDGEEEEGEANDAHSSVNDQNSREDSPTNRSHAVSTDEPWDAGSVACPGSEFGCGVSEVSHGELASHVESCIMAKLAAKFDTQSKRMQSLESENRTLKRQVDVFQHLVRKNAHELDSQILMEYDRLVRELRDAESTLAGQESAISNLVAENTRINAKVSYMSATMDSVHRQLFLLSQSQRRLSLHSSLLAASAASPTIDNSDVEDGLSRRRSQQKL